MSETTPTQNKGPGRPQGSAPVDLVEVERLAALGMNQAQIAEGIGIGHSKWFKDKANNQEFADAYKRGQLQIRVKVLERLEAAAAKNFIVPMFMSKQQHILGFSDQAMDVKHGGKLELVVRHEIAGLEKGQDVIDVTPAGNEAIEQAVGGSNNSSLED